MALVPGATIGHFRIIRLLGQGGMGEVYEAADTNLDRPVALKVLLRDQNTLPEHQNPILAEARRAAKINSLYVVKVWEVSTTDGVSYIAMEYASGPDLRSMIPVGELKLALNLIQWIGEGIQAAHSQGIVHRDLKPENIKLSENGEPKILDFGLSEDVDCDTVDITGKITGTLHYLAPEQMSGAPATFQSDLFSFGTICYELLTGSRPFEGSYPASVIYSILHEEPIPPTERRTNLPVWIDAFIGKLHAKNPIDRFHDMKAALEFLEASWKGTAQPASLDYKTRQRNVTVVDLRNLSGDPNWNYFCQGFTEDVIRELSRRTKLTVNAEPSTEVERDVREVFKRCRSDFVVAGSLLRWLDKVKLNLAIYGSDGNRLIAAENHEGDVTDLFSILAKAAEQTSMVLAKESGASALPVSGPRSTDVTAYDLYLRARNYYQGSTAQDFNHAIQLYKKALAIEPEFALAHAGLADVYSSQYMAWYERTKERIELAQREANTALTLNPELPEAHRSLGRYFQFIENPIEAERCFIHAIEFDSKFALGYRSLGWLKRGVGNYDQAAHFARKALELAPTDLETLLLLSLISIDQRQFTPALATLQRAIELGPDYGRAYYNLGCVYMKLGVFDLALENFLQAIEFKGDPNCYTDAGYLYAATGKHEEAKEMLTASIELGYLPFVAHYFLALAEMGEGNSDKAKAEFATVVTLTNKEADDPNLGDIHTLGFHAMALAGLGQQDSAIHILTILERRGADQGEVLLCVARAYALLGEKTKAEEVLNRSFHTHAGPTPREVAIDPHFVTLRR